MSAVAVVTIALVCTGVLYFERRCVLRDVEVRARDRWDRTVARASARSWAPLLRDVGSRVGSGADPVGSALTRAIHAGDLAVAYQRRFTARYRGWETPFEFKRARVHAAFERFEEAVADAAASARGWLDDHAETARTLPCRRALEDVCSLTRARYTSRDPGVLAQFENHIGLLENARLLLLRWTLVPAVDTDPFRGEPELWG